MKKFKYSLMQKEKEEEGAAKNAVPLSADRLPG
jgi:hypothetical protein